MNNLFFTQDSQPFSPWSLCGFTYNEQYYPTLEHFIAVQKLNKVNENIPEDFWKLPNAQYAYDTARHAGGRTDWDEYERWLIEAQQARILCHPWLYEDVFGKTDVRYVYANKDMRLGIGLPPQSTDVKYEEKWKGENRMGQAMLKASLELPLTYHIGIPQLSTARAMIEQVIEIINHTSWTPQEKKDVLVDKKLVFYANALLLSLGYPDFPKAESLKEAQSLWTVWGYDIILNLTDTIESLQYSQNDVTATSI